MPATMTCTPPLRPEHRAEPRVVCLGGRMRWRCREGGPTWLGWTRDRSPSGLAFLTEYAGLPRLGTDLLIRAGRRHWLGPCRVVRVRPLSPRLALIACRRPCPRPRVTVT